MLVTLKSKDGQQVKVLKKACAKSKVLEKYINEGKSEIVLDEIKGDVLKLVVYYLNYYSDKETPTIPGVIRSNDLSQEVCEWDFKFVNPLSYELTFNLINAGLSLELEHLHNLACAKIASFMRGKTPDEINTEFTIECQLSKEEAKKLGLDAS